MGKDPSFCLNKPVLERYRSRPKVGDYQSQDRNKTPSPADMRLETESSIRYLFFIGKKKSLSIPFSRVYTFLLLLTHRWPRYELDVDRGGTRHGVSFPTRRPSHRTTIRSGIRYHRAIHPSCPRNTLIDVHPILLQGCLPAVSHLL